MAVDPLFAHPFITDGKDLCRDCGEPADALIHKMYWQGKLAKEGPAMYQGVEKDYHDIVLNGWGTNSFPDDIFIMGTNDPRVSVGTVIRCNDPERTRGLVVRSVPRSEYIEWLKRWFDISTPEWSKAFEVRFD